MRTTIRIAILGLFAVLLAAPMLRAQDLSKYRRFSLGTNLAAVLKLTNQTAEEVNVTHAAPAWLQELTWWPPSLPEASFTSNSVQRILFSFYNGELYKISVTYDQVSTEGLTAEDIVRSVSAQYGPPAALIPPVLDEHNRYDVKEKTLATWENDQYSLNLICSSFSDRFGLVIYSKQVKYRSSACHCRSVENRGATGSAKRGGTPEETNGRTGNGASEESEEFPALVTAGKRSTPDKVDEDRANSSYTYTGTC